MPSIDLDATFLALADPTRRAILARLAEGEALPGDLARPFAISQPAITKHLKVLERARLISVSVDGKRRPRRMNPEPLAEAQALIRQYQQRWEAHYARLDAVLTELQEAASADRKEDCP